MAIESGLSASIPGCLVQPLYVLNDSLTRQMVLPAFANESTEGQLHPGTCPKLPY